MRVTQPFDLAQGHESFDLAQDRELVERLVEWQMGVFRQPQRVSAPDKPCGAKGLRSNDIYSTKSSV